MANQILLPSRIFVGEKALDEAGIIFKQFGKKALIVTDPMMVKLKNTDELEKVLKEHDISYEVYDGITGEPTDIMIDGGKNIFENGNCDFLIALGGGSALDSMKAIAVATASGTPIADFMGKEITIKTAPMIAIPTTAGTGSEATQFTIITDSVRQIKMLLKGTSLLPEIAIVDPRFTMTAPPSVTAATGLDALTHAAEAYTSKKANMLTDVFAVSALKRIFQYLPIAYRDGRNTEARVQMSVAALEAGIAFNNSSVTLVHGMSRPIGALFHVPHGISNAMLLGECFSFALDGAYKRFGDLGRAIGSCSENTDDQLAAEAFLSSVKQICKTCEIPTLAKWGIKKEDFFAVIDKMCQDAMDSGSPSNTRKPLTKEDLKIIYKKLWI